VTTPVLELMADLALEGYYWMEVAGVEGRREVLNGITSSFFDSYQKKWTDVKGPSEWRGNVDEAIRIGQQARENSWRPFYGEALTSADVFLGELSYSLGGGRKTALLNPDGLRLGDDGGFGDGRGAARQRAGDGGRVRSQADSSGEGRPVPPDYMEAVQMPVQTTYPGVYIEELPSGVHTIVGVSTSVTAFVGAAAQGAANTPVRIFSVADFVRTFGQSIDQDHPLGYAVAHFFTNGGSEAVIVRVLGAGSAAAAVTLQSAEATPKNVLVLTASGAGAWANRLAGRGLDVTVDRAGSANPDDLFNVVLTSWTIDPRTNASVVAAREEYLNLSMSPSHPRYVLTVVGASALSIPSLATPLPTTTAKGSSVGGAAVASPLTITAANMTMHGNGASGAAITATGTGGNGNTTNGNGDGGAVTITVGNCDAVPPTGDFVTEPGAKIQSNSTKGAAGAIVVASKIDTEGALLGNLIAAMLEARGLAVERRIQLGPTNIVRAAILAGQIDIYPEYTGTGLLAILGERPSSDPRQVYRQVAREFRARFGTRWLPPLGFQNTYAIAVRRETAVRFRLRTLSDLARVSGTMRADRDRTAMFPSNVSTVRHSKAIPAASRAARVRRKYPASPKYCITAHAAAIGPPLLVPRTPELAYKPPNQFSVVKV
jgi:hypothetical protein